MQTQYFVAQLHDVDAAAYVEDALPAAAFRSFVLHHAMLPARCRTSLQRTSTRGGGRRSIYFTAPALVLTVFGSPMDVTIMSSLRWIRVVAFSEASSKPCPWVMASVGQASSQ